MAGARRDAVRRRDLRGPGRQPVRRSRRGPGLDLRASTSTPPRYTIAQRYVADGNRPDPASVRVEEWVNAFDQGYRRARRRRRSPILADGGPTPFTEPDEVLLRIGLQARDVRDRAREDAALTFVIDTSGSMEREDRLELVKDALRLLVDDLGRGDTRRDRHVRRRRPVVLLGRPGPPTSNGILEAIDELRPGRLDQPRGRPAARL